MAPRPTLPFRVAFISVTSLEILGDVLPVRWLHYGSKPLIMALLLLYVWQSYQFATYPGFMRWLITGMAVALIGDVLLMIQEVDLFAPGLGAFLIMQVCYSVTFIQMNHRRRQPIRLQSAWAKAIPFLIFVISFLVVLRPTLISNPKLSAIWWPVVTYAICLGTMGFLSTQRQGLPYAGQVLIGALLFIFSDSVIAIDKFLTPFAGAPWLIMATYAAAQYLIVTGITLASLTRAESNAISSV